MRRRSMSLSTFVQKPRMDSQLLNTERLSLHIRSRQHQHDADADESGEIGAF